MTLVLVALLLASASKQPSVDPSGWVRVEAPEAGFSATFPQPPMREEMPIQIAGHPARLRSYVVERANTRWAVGVMESGGSLSREELDRLPEGLVAFMQNVAKKTAVQRQGRPGCEVEVRSGGDEALMLYVAGQDRVYSVIVAAKSARVPLEARAFLDGFRMIPVVAAAASSPAKPVAEWEEYMPEGARFAARFPSRPKDMPGQTADGHTTHTFVTEQNGVSYSVLVVPAPWIGGRGRHYVDNFAHEMRTKLAQNAHPPDITVSEPGTTSRLPSRDVSVVDSGTTVFIRVVAAPDTIYQVRVFGMGVPVEPGRTRFVESFRALMR